MFGPWIVVRQYMKNVFPSLGRFKIKLPKLKFNFIYMHYTYLISLTLMGSVILYGTKNLAYIDALFLASGAATQSGLNTVNLNDIELYQQIVLMLIACIANPIFINTFVVFIRLYWFEKRFQNVVLEAQRFRRTRERSRTRSQAKDQDTLDHDAEERGVGNRKIVVMHPGDRTMDVAERGSVQKIASEKDDDDGVFIDSQNAHHEYTEKGFARQDVEARSSGDSSGNASTSATPATDGSTKTADETPDANIDTAKKIEEDDEAADIAPFRRNITFADEIGPAPGTGLDKEPNKHIAFLERQRDTTHKKALYIPGPRDFDRGEKPEEIDHHETHPKLTHQNSLDDLPNTDDEDGNAATHLRKKLTNKLSLDDAASAFNKARRGITSALKPGHNDGHNDGHSEGPSAASSEKDVDLQRSSTEGITAPTLRRRGRARTFASFMSKEDPAIDPLPYLSYTATIGRNSAFVNLTEEQREELGGIEYRSLKTLAFVLVCYFVGFHLFGIICLVPYILRDTYERAELQGYGVNKTWWGIFTSASMFNDLGYTLTPNSMNGFALAVWPLLIGSYLIVIGNTGFPCMLRFVIWVSSKLVPRGSSIWEEFRFLLDHPRRCFTLLFPSSATWWLFWILVIMNGLDLIFFIILDIGDGLVSKLPPGYRVLDGAFQAFSTRTAGFSVINLADLHPGVQVSYLIMMYISVFPIAISVRRTNVYEEKSLGVFAHDLDADEDGPTQSYIGNHLRRQLSFDLWYVFLGLFVICIVEGSRLSNHNQYAFTVFAVLFEVVSAYGTVGLSLGYPTTDASFSSQFHSLSKLVIIAMQIRGRHRGLPYALDKAILLPSEEHAAKEQEMSEMFDRMRRASAAARQEDLAAMATANVANARADSGDSGYDGPVNGADGTGVGDVSSSGFPSITQEQSKSTTVRDLKRVKSKKGRVNVMFRIMGQLLGAGPAKED